MAFLTLRINLDGLDEEVVEQACFDAGAYSITYTDQRDDPILEPAPGEFRLWPASRLEAVFGGDTDSAALIEELTRALGATAQQFEVAQLADRVWEREWLKDFQPMRFGRRLWICPTHSEAPTEPPDRVIVRLDPGLAFGTGTHATTAMCLEWLDASAALGVDTGRIIDYGCGSGILAIAALALGAGSAEAFDIDPQALTATRDNAESNGLAGRLRIVASSEALQPAADRVVANILAGPLVELAPRLAALCRPGGALALAGLLDSQADEVMAAYEPWFVMREFARREGWVCLSGSRRGPMSVTIAP